MPHPVLYASPPGKLPAWKIEQSTGDPRVVWFTRMGKNRQLMFKVAKWSGRKWDKRYWVPQTPGVPIGILREVTAAMVQWEILQQTEVK